MANTYILVGTSSSGTRTKWTTSFWIKRNDLSSDNVIFGAYLDGSNFDRIKFNSDGTFEWQSYQAGSYSNGGKLKTERAFRDGNAWYHFVCRWDTSNATANNRMKIWVNGEEISDFAERTNPTSGRESLINYQQITAIGRMASDYLDGCMSHVHFCDNQLYQASDFGETDSTTGEWKIKTSPSVSYGTTGYFILKDGNSLTDQSGNGNDFSLQGGTLTKTEDNPSNVFATFNPLTRWRGQNRQPSQVLANGNLKTGIGTTEAALLTSTIGVKSGKWYWEAKSDGVSKMFFGICNTGAFGETGAPHDHSDGATSTGIYYYEAIPDFRYYSGATSTTGISSMSTGDVLGFAMDCDNSFLWIHKNGVYMNSGDPTSGASGTGAINSLFNYAGYLFYRNGVKTEMFPSCYVSSSSGSGTASFNFGNGYFGTTAVSTPGTNASGNGIFEYDVPTGFTALSTKGLNL